MAAAAVDNHNAASSCLDDPNFATICSFIEKFGESCNLGDLPYDYLQEMLENTNETPPKLAQIHIQLLRRVYKTVAVDKWEKQLAKFGHSYNSQDGWEIERFGYKKAKIQTKLRLLKTLLEAQFDFNVKFKNEVNKLPAEELRRQPIGRDSEGQLYWYQVDPDANLRIYREDIDDETWEVAASNREEMLQLIEDLSNGVVKKNSVVEDENVDGELSPKEILLDTGKVADEQAAEDDGAEEDEDEDAMQIDESYGHSVEEKVDPENSASETVSKRLNDETQSGDVKPSAPDASVQEIASLVESSTDLNSKTLVEAKLTTDCEIAQPNTSNERLEVKHEVQPISEITSRVPASSEPQSKDSCLNEQNSHSVGSNGNSDHLVKSDSFNLDLQKGSSDSNDNIQTSQASRNFKEPLLMPLATKATGQDPLNIDIWNPAVHDSSKLNADNHKHLRTTTTEAKSASKHLQKQRHLPVQLSSNWNKSAELTSTSEPSPLDNLKMLTQMMSVEAHTLSEDLRKVTAEIPDDLEESGIHTGEIDNGEKFVKPESSISMREKELQRGHSSRRSEKSKSNTAEPGKVCHARKNKPLEVEKQVPIAQKSDVRVPVESQDLNTSSSSQKVEGCLPSDESSTRQEVRVELCTPTPATEETDAKVLSGQIPGEVVDSQEKKQETPVELLGTPQQKPGDAARDSSVEHACTDNTSVTAHASVESESAQENIAPTSEVADIVDTSSSKTINQPSDSQTSSIHSAANENQATAQAENAKNEPEPTANTEISTGQENAPLSVPSEGEQELTKSVSEACVSNVGLQGTVPGTSSSSIHGGDVDVNKINIEEPSFIHPNVDTNSKQKNKETAEDNIIGKDIPSVDDLDNKTTHEKRQELKVVPEESGQGKSADDVQMDRTKAEIVEPPVTKSRAWLVGYEDSSNDEDSTVDSAEETVKTQIEQESVLNASVQNIPSDIGANASQEIPRSVDDTLVDESLTKRKSDTTSQLESCSPEKKARVDDCIRRSESVNPIIGEVIEEETMIIIGEGSGAELQGGNKRRSSEMASEEQENGDGNGTKAKNAGRKKKSEGSRKTPTPRRKSFGNELNDLTPAERSVTELNGSSSTERPMRQSRRIAQIREKEEVERRRLEEEHLAQLKQAQLQKQQKQKETEQGSKKRKSDGKGKATGAKLKSKQTSKTKTQEYLPSPSISESESDNDESFELPKGKGKRGRRGKKNEEQKFKKGIKPWLHSSSDDDEAIEEEEEEVHEEEEEIPFDKSDHEFSPESDLGEDEEVSPSRHARTAKIGPDAVDKYATTVCDKCTKGDHPEWILLCDACDKGWHASCLRPQLWVIPEGEWFCPPCQHKKLVEKLGESLIEFDKILKKRENEELRRKRLAYVGISMENVLPADNSEKPEKKSQHRSNKHSRRRILSDEEESEHLDDFINDKDEDRSSGSKYLSSEESDDEPIYKLRARRATKAFNFKEYDEMINSALKDDDEDYDEINDMKEEAVKEKAENEAQKPKSEEDLANQPEEADEESKAQDSVPSEENILDEKERKYQELEKASQRKSRRRLNDLDATSDDDSDEDFKDSNGDDDEDEEEIPEDDSEWSGDRDADESDESIGRLRRQAKKERKYGRRETYLEVGSVRRSTRRVKPKYQYDESDQEDDDNDAAEPWEEENSEESASNSESEDETWGKKKNKKKAPPPAKSSRSAMRSFVLPESSKNRRAAKKKKKKPAGSDDEDRPWNRGGTKAKKAAEDSVQQRTTRGKKINFKDILDSGESDDDGNIRPKRRRVVAPESDDSDGPSSSKKLVAELNNANLKAAAAAADKERAVTVKEIQDNGAQQTRSVLTNEPQIPAANGATETKSPLIPEIPKPIPEEELKPIPAPPYPPVRNQLREVLKRNIETSKPPVSQPPSTSLLMSEILATPPIRTPSPSRKSTPAMAPPTNMLSTGPPPTSVPQPIHRGMSPQHTSVPSDISGVMDPSFIQRAQAMRAFHPAWVRSPLPPPSYGNHAPGGPSPSPPTSLGKPPPLRGLPFISQSSARSPYSSPSSLGIPGPNTQSFQQFKRDVELPMYRLPPNLPGLPPRSANLLPQMHPGLGHPNPHLEQFYGTHASPFGIPGYGLPPHSQSQPMFSPPQHYDYRGDGSFKNEIMGHGGNFAAPPGQVKEDMNPNPGPGDGEFGGLVSYFSSQRGDDDLDP